MTEGFWVALAGGGSAGAIAFITFWMTLSARITEADTRSKNAETLSTAALAKFELMIGHIHEHRADVLSKIAAINALTDFNNRSLVAIESRLTKLIEDNSAKMDSLQSTMLQAMGDLAGRQPLGPGGR